MTTAMGDYRNTPAPDDDPRVEQLAEVVCHLGGHIPNRDRSLPGSCIFHLRMAAGYVRVIDAASEQ